MENIMNQAQAILFDLGALKTLQATTHKCDVLFDGAGQGYAGFVMVGKNSPEYRAAQRDIRVTNMARGAQRKKDIDTSTEEGAAVVIDTVDSNDLRIACAVVTGWYGFGSADQEAPFNKDQLPEIFAAMPSWKERVLADLEREANFMPASSNA